MSTNVSTLPIQRQPLIQPIPLPPLSWVKGTVHQILVQPGEKFFVFSVKDSATTLVLRIADPHSGLPIAVDSENPIFNLMKEAYFRNLTVEVGYRDFGNDPQAGIKNLCIDRVSLVQ